MTLVVSNSKSFGRIVKPFKLNSCQWIKGPNDLFKEFKSGAPSATFVLCTAKRDILGVKMLLFHQEMCFCQRVILRLRFVLWFRVPSHSESLRSGAFRTSCSTKYELITKSTRSKILSFVRPSEALIVVFVKN